MIFKAATCLCKPLPCTVFVCSKSFSSLDLEAYIRSTDAVNATELGYRQTSLEWMGDLSFKNRDGILSVLLCYKLEIIISESP